ncbi:MAG: hypothetical protein U0746_10685 [Gemmataceae bacterium]
MPPEPQQQQPAAEDTSMNWVMVFWLFAFLTAVLFGVGAYLYNWFAGK